MKDRVSANPGRVKLTPEDGSPAFYATMERADNPTEEGTPLNKSTLLSDAACDLLEIPQTSTVNEAFLRLAVGVGKYGYTVHFQWPDGTPMVGYQVSGLTAIDGSALTTDDTGTVFGISSATSVYVQLSQNEYFDIDTVGGTLNSTGMLTEGTFKAKVRTGTFPYIDSSRSALKFSQWAPLVDICAVGGGGSGGAASGSNNIDVGPVFAAVASGGAGGYVNVLRNYNPAGKTLTVTIGAGGSSVSASSSTLNRSGNSGGTTSVTVGGSTLVSANGGDGGDAGHEGAAYNDYASLYVYRVNGGSGAGRAQASARGDGYSQGPAAAATVTASGSDGSDGENGPYAGKGQGTTTTFAGIMYSSAGGGAAKGSAGSSPNVEQSAEQPGASGAGAGKVGGNGGNGTTKGAGGGGVIGNSFKSGAGAGGRVIIKTA